MDELLCDVSRDQFDAVIVADTSRWSRDNQKNEQGLNILRDAGILFFSLTNEYDLWSPEQRFNLGVQGASHQYEARKGSTRSVENRIELAKRGWLMTGTGPYGRRIRAPSASKNGNAEWEVIPEVQAEIKRLYQLYTSERFTFDQLAERTGENSETIRRRLRDGCGDKLVQKFKYKGKQQIISTDIPPLLNSAEIANLKLVAKQRQIFRTICFIYSLAHLVRCGNCGAVLSGHGDKRKKGKTQRAYTHPPKDRLLPGCTSYVRAADLENAIFFHLGILLRETDGLRSAIRAAIASQENKAGEVKQTLSNAEAVLKEKVKEQKHLIDLLSKFQFETGSPTQAALQRKITEMDGDLVRLADDISRLEAQLVIVSIPSDLEERVQKTMGHLIGRYGWHPMAWPPLFQKELAIFFFGARVKGSDDKGIFVRKVQHPHFFSYLTYEAKGVLGMISGALTELSELEDKLFQTEKDGVISTDHVRQLVGITDRLSKEIPIAKVKPDTYSPRW